MSDYKDLFDNDALDAKMDFLEEKKVTGKDGLYRVDLSKVKDKKRGYVATVRFLPNFTEAGKIGPMSIEKVTHYVNLKQMPDLAGYYDSPKNINPETGTPFSDSCPLTDCYWNLKNSKNAILQEKANLLNYSKKYFSYIMVIEDGQQPELEGKILIYQYGKTIKDKIAQERNGDISGEPCNVFSLNNGKDFRLLVKEVQDDKGNTFPDYRMCQFRPQTSTVSVPTSNGIKNVPLGEDGKIAGDFQEKIINYLKSRDNNLEDFGPKRLTEEKQGNVTEIINFLTGKVSNSYNSTKNEPEADDFSFDDVSESMESETELETTSSTSTKSDSGDFDFEF